MVGIIVYLIIGLILACAVYSKELENETMDDDDYRVFFMIWGLYPIALIVGILKLFRK